MATRQHDNSQNHAQSAYSPRESQPSVSHDMNARQRAEQAIQLRVLGYSYTEIAKRCGYRDPSGARKAIKTLRDRLLLDDVRDATALQAERIDRAVRECMEWIEQQPTKDRLWALDRLVPLLKRQAELLGLDAKDDAPTAAQVVFNVVGAEAV